MPVSLLPLLAAAWMAARGPALAQSDPRSTVLLHLDCASGLGRRELTLFGNGTLRLRRTTAGAQPLVLAELAPEELAAVVERLGELDLSEVEDVSEGPEGEWIERCAVELAVPGAARRTCRFGRSAALSLGLGRLVQLAEQLAARAEASLGGRLLPPDYLPRRGDVLRRADGRRFAVVGLTADGHGVELEGLDDPVVIFVPAGAMAQEFLALEPGHER